MLNSIAFLHIRKATEKWLDERRAEGARIAVIDAPMLYESGFDRLCDKVVSVIDDRPTQIDREAASVEAEAGFLLPLAVRLCA